MIWRELLKEGMAERHRTSPEELEGLRGIVRRNLADAANVSVSPDTRFACAYEAALGLATMAIAHAGYRIKGPGHHRMVFLAVQLVLTDEQERAEATYFDACRRLRNQLSYESAGVVTEGQVEELCLRVKAFQKRVEFWLVTARDKKPRAGGSKSGRRSAVESLGPAYRLLITLRDLKPRIWRLLEVDSRIRLSDLHSILQRVMPWKDTHLHTFTAGERTFGPALQEWGLDVIDERKVRLNDVLTEVGQRMRYEYDHGDGWNHRIELQRILPHDPERLLPSVIQGDRACPPEDCGGPPGYEHLLEVLANPRHDEFEELSEWVGPSFDPERFDVAAVNRKLRPRSRNATPASRKVTTRRRPQRAPARG